MDDPLVDVIIPTFGRADRLSRVVEDVQASVAPGVAIVTLVVEADDEASIQAAKATDARVVVNDRSHNYTGAMNTAVLTSGTPLWFAGADDLHFHPGWLEECCQHIDGWVAVVGTNDLLNPYTRAGLHATHYLVVAEYVRQCGGTLTEGPGIAYFEGTFHDYSDTEFVGVAKARCRFRPCLEAVVEHMHWLAGKAEHDATYEKNEASVAADRAVYLQRKRAWDDLVL